MNMGTEPEFEKNYLQENSQGVMLSGGKSGRTEIEVEVLNSWIRD